VAAVEPVDVYFDYVSPFAYLAAEVLPDFALRHGLALHWKPVALGGLGNFAAGLPYSASKRRYVAVDAARQAAFHGVAIETPRPFPVASARALCLAAVTLGDARFGTLHRALFRAAWREQRDLSAEEVLRDCIAQAGGPAEDWLRDARAGAAWQRVEAFTAEAEAAGVFGVPSLVIRGELFWGLDSLPILAWQLER